MGKTSAAQLKASKKWDNAHKERKQYIRDKSVAKNFILKKANEDDLKLLSNWILERQK